jgi:uncharacterized protein YukJ
MPVKNYGVSKAKPTRYTYETDEQDSRSPHLELYYSNDDHNERRAAINIKSGDQSESRLVFWTVPNFRHLVTDSLANLSLGFHKLSATDEMALDYIRSNLFQPRSGMLLPHDIPGRNNDILDSLQPIIDRAISSKATVYIFGSGFGDSKGIHNVHMNQGSSRRWAHDNGIYHDGCLIIQFEDHWEGVFIGFASQAVHTGDTDPEAGQPTPPQGYLTWADFFQTDNMPEDRDKNEPGGHPVLTSKDLVNPDGPDNQPGAAPETVTLSNRSPVPIATQSPKTIQQIFRDEYPDTIMTQNVEIETKSFMPMNIDQQGDERKWLENIARLYVEKGPQDLRTLLVLMGETRGVRFSVDLTDFASLLDGRIDSVLIVTGSSQDAFANTAACYVSWHWGQRGMDILNWLSQSLSAAQQSGLNTCESSLYLLMAF